MLKFAHIEYELLQTTKMLAFKDGVNALICIGLLLLNSLSVVLTLTDTDELEIDF